MHRLWIAALAALLAAGIAAHAGVFVPGGDRVVGAIELYAGDPPTVTGTSGHELYVICSSGCGSGSGDATAANQTTANTDLGPPGATACATDTGSCSLNALMQRIAQRITSAISALGSPLQAGGSVVAAGTTAASSSISANPVTAGGRARTSEPTAVTDGQVVNQGYTATGAAIMMPYANPENSVYGVTAAITDTTSTSTIASAGGSLRNYVTDCMVTNSHATVGTFVKILDGSTIIDEGYAAAAGGGFSRIYPVPRRGTAATAVNCQPVTTGANTICSCGGYKGV